MSPSGEWDLLRLVRNSYGAPDYSDDGVVLLETPSSSVTQLLDTDLGTGIFHYYSVFVRDSEFGNWHRAASTIGLTTHDYDYSDVFFRRLAGWFQEQDQDISRGGFDEGPLQRFLRITGLAADFSRSEIETARWLRRPDSISGNLLPLLADTFGVPVEPSIGMRRTRFWVRDATFLHRSKGTIPGIQAITTTITGWGSRVTRGTNILKGTDALAWFEATGSSVGDDASLSDFSTWNVAVKAEGTTGWEISSGPIDDSAARFHGVVVEGESFYQFGLEARAVDVDATITPKISWFDMNESLISQTIFDSGIVSSGGWTSIVSDTFAPVGAVYATVQVEGNEDAFLRRVHLTPEFADIGWEPPFALDIELLPVRTNLVHNPSFQYGVDGWSISDGSIVRDDTTSFSGDASLHVDIAGVDPVVSSVPLVLINSDTRHTASTWTKDLGLEIRVRWFDENDVETGVTPWRSAQEGGNTWHRASVSGFPPPATTQGIVEFSVSEGTILDAVLFESSDSVGEYFDGSFFGADYIWEDQAHSSMSFFFPQRSIRNNRLLNLLPDYLPLNQPFMLRYFGPVSGTTSQEAEDEALGMGVLGIIPMGEQESS